MKSDMDKWKRIYRSWEKSGLSRKEFCRQNQLAKSTFYYWQKKLNETERRKDSIGTRELVKLPISSSRNKNDVFILEFPGGYRLQIPQHSSPTDIKTIISDLRDILS